MNKIYPKKLREIIESLQMTADPSDRAQMLIDYAYKFEEVPVSVAQRPFSERNKIPACESDAYIWAIDNQDNTLKFFFAVENPSGISAKALAVILDKTLSGLHSEEIIQIEPDIVYDIFRQNISMGKGLGLMSMVHAVKKLAEQHLKKNK